MQLTKYEHACLDLTEGNERLIVDPGEYSGSLKNLQSINLVVITHVHPDHLDQAKLEAIYDANPEVKIYTTKEVAQALDNFEVPNSSVTVPNVGQEYQLGNFNLEFFGGQHAEITATLPVAQNYGVLINQNLYYPGDSFTPCPKPHTSLMLPVMAPWLKFSETDKFLRDDGAQNIFPTHNGFINKDGQDLYDRYVGGAAAHAGKTYHFLAVGESIDL